MKYLAMLLLLGGTFMSAQDTAKVYLVAIDGSYSAGVDGVMTKIEGKHYVEHKVLPGWHNIGYQFGYFGGWTATSLKASAGQDYYFVFSSAPGSGRMCSQISPSQGQACLRALENGSGTEPCRAISMNLNSLRPSWQTPAGNLLPWGFHTLTPR